MTSGPWDDKPAKKVDIVTIELLRKDFFMTKQNQTGKEQNVSDISEIEAERKKLSSQIDGVFDELAKVGREITENEQAKVEAKRRYGEGLDAGDETLMAGSLARIREANGRRQNLINSLAGFPEKIQALEKAYVELVHEAQRCRLAAEEKVESAQREYKQVDSAYDSCERLSSQTRNVTERLTKIQDEICPQEPRAEKIAGRIENCPGNV
jgi:chromosome segregation ATPase